MKKMMGQMMEEAGESPMMEKHEQMMGMEGTKKDMPMNMPKVAMKPKKPMKKRIRSISDLRAAANELGVKKQKMGY